MDCRSLLEAEYAPNSSAVIWGIPKIRGTLLGVPITRVIYSILGSIFGSPSFGKLPFSSGLF